MIVLDRTRLTRPVNIVYSKKIKQQPLLYSDKSITQAAVFFLIFVISRFAEAYERNYNGEHIEHLAKYAANGKIIYVVYYPKRRDKEELRTAYDFAVACPHCKRTARLRYEEEEGYPNDLVENKYGYERGCCEADFHYQKIDYLFASFSKSEDDAAQNAEYIQEHSRKRAQ